MKIDVGTAYYPEDWDNNRVEYDANLMKKAGLTHVRMAEFAWSRLEPTEGNYQFQWLQDAVRIFGEHGILTILCTPSSAAPAWMCRKYPEILRQKRSGEKAWFGVRDHTCYTSAKYRELVCGMVHQMTSAFKDNPYVVGWQIDNESGCSRFQECFCPDCQAAFREYVRRKYQTLENLNQAWHTTFWSGEFTSWDEVELEADFDNMGSCRQVESRRFRSHQQADFILMQAEIIRRAMPQALIGTNNYCGADRYEVFDKLDFAGNDYYPNYRTENMTDPVKNKYEIGLYAGLKQDVAPWIMETPPCPGWPVKDMTRFFFWLFIAYGYDKIFYFQWNNHLGGNEKDHPYVIPPFGRPTHQYDLLRDICGEAERVLCPYSELPLPRSPYALVLDYENEWIYAGGFTSRNKSLHDAIHTSFAALCQVGGYAEIVSPDADWSRYKLLILPCQAYVSRQTADKLEQFTKAGGVVVMNGSAGCFDGNGNHLTVPGPEHLQKLFGVTIGENRHMSCREPLLYEDSADFALNNVIVRGELDNVQVSGTIGQWTGYISADTSEVLMRFDGSVLDGCPFCTIKPYGNGFAVYYAADRIDQALCNRIIRFAAGKAGMKPVPYPESILMTRRGPLVFVINFSKHQVEFPFEDLGKNVIGNALTQGKITLPEESIALIEINGESI
ncbi:MAG: beta-galactosidase [Victivallales bacterium]|nr:beta-galactosidase [Victivallales bacterium]